jgi:uncharacterized protein (DUF433 family)
MAGRPCDSTIPDLPDLHLADAGQYACGVQLDDHIIITPGIRSGKPRVKGTRITVYDILEYLTGGMTEDQILADFPSLNREDIRACLAFAAARERRLASSRAA